MHLPAPTACPVPLSMVPISGSLSQINLPVYGHLIGKNDLDYVLVKATTLQLTTSGLPFTILDPDSQGATYAVVSHFTNDTIPNLSPFVTILYNDGKNIILKADPAKSDSLLSSGLELQWMSTVPMVIPERADYRLTEEPEITYDSRIAGMLAQVTRDALNLSVASLSGEQLVTVGGIPYTIHSRRTDSGEPITKATSYVYEHLDGLNLTVSYEPWSYSTYSCRNVIAEKTGTLHPDEIVLVTAHLDSYSGVKTDAPGADDDASGTAAVLLFADIMDQHQFERTVRFVLFTGEEQGLIGSLAHANAAYENGENIVAVFNMDMIATERDGIPVIDIHTRPKSDTVGYSDDMVLAGIFTRSVDLYGLQPFLDPDILSDGVSYSDHYSFWYNGYPAILAIEDDDDFSPYYHTVSDLRKYLNFEYYTYYTKASLATVAHLAHICSPPVISGIIPNSAPNSQPVYITNLVGSNFQTNAIVNLTRSGYANITAINIAYSSSSQITCVLPITGKTAGAWNLTVQNPDGRTGFMKDAFTITSRSVPVEQIGIFRNGMFLLDYDGNYGWSGSGTTSTTDRIGMLGQSGDIPLVGDWNSDGRDEFGIFRNGMFLLDYDGSYGWSGGGSTSTTDRIGWLGKNGDTPLIGNWNGDSKDEIGIFRSGMFLLDYDGSYGWSGGGSSSTTDRIGWLGQSGDAPLIGAWSGSSTASVLTENSISQPVIPIQPPQISTHADAIPKVKLPVMSSTVCPEKSGVMPSAQNPLSGDMKPYSVRS